MKKLEYFEIKYLCEWFFKGKMIKKFFIRSRLFFGYYYNRYILLYWIYFGDDNVLIILKDSKCDFWKNSSNIINEYNIIKFLFFRS